MVTWRVRNYLYRLDDIYNEHRRAEGNRFFLFFPKVVRDYCAYWRGNHPIFNRS